MVALILAIIGSGVIFLLLISWLIRGDSHDDGGSAVGYLKELDEWLYFIELDMKYNPEANRSILSSKYKRIRKTRDNVLAKAKNGTQKEISTSCSLRYKNEKDAYRILKKKFGR